MSELCKNKTPEEIRKLSTAFRAMMLGEKTGDQLPELGDASALEGVKKFSARIKCAMLAWEAVEKCLDQVLGNNSGLFVRRFTVLTVYVQFSITLPACSLAY